MIRTLLVGSMVRTLLVGSMGRAELWGSLLRTVLVEFWEAACAAAASGLALPTASRCAVAGRDEGFAVTGGAGNGSGVSLAAIESRPVLLATVSLVITGVVDAFRFERFASSTSGESCAETVAETSRIGMILLNTSRW
ncbi:MAG TPA: hypothetical protein VF701_20825 [Thermoanaerobaculia bacterium]